MPDKDPNGLESVDWSIGKAAGVGLAAFLLPQVFIGTVLVFVAQSQDKKLSEIVTDENVLLSFAITTFISLSGAGIVWFALNRKNVWRRLGFVKTRWDDIGLAFPGYLVYFVLAFVANLSLSIAFPEVADQEQQTGFMDAAGYELVLAFITLVLMAPLYEEMLFRGFVFRGLAKALSFWPAAITVSALFGLAHGQINVAVDTFLIGMVASWLVWHTKSIWPAILLHVIKNLVAYIFIFVIEVDV